MAGRPSVTGRQYVKIRIAERFPETCCFSTTSVAGEKEKGDEVRQHACSRKQTISSAPFAGTAADH
jgi:hypothetical protein